jgi:hypothetical protein
VTRIENLTAFVDGTRDTFSTVNPYRPGTLVIGYNGQIFPPGFNVAEEVSTTSFRLTFAPASDTTFLTVMYEDFTGEIVEIVASSMPPISST